LALVLIAVRSHPIDLDDGSIVGRSVIPADAAQQRNCRGARTRAPTAEHAFDGDASNSHDDRGDRAELGRDKSLMCSDVLVSADPHAAERSRNADDLVDPRKPVIEVLVEPARNAPTSRPKTLGNAAIGLQRGLTGWAGDHGAVAGDTADLGHCRRSVGRRDVLEQIDREDDVEGSVCEWQGSHIADDMGAARGSCPGCGAIVLEVGVEHRRTPTVVQKARDAMRAAPDVEQGAASPRQDLEHGLEPDEVVHLAGSEKAPAKSERSAVRGVVRQQVLPFYSL
jgi:hypothetical protein